MCRRRSPSEMIGRLSITHTGSVNRNKRDGNFQGFGRFLTGSTGEYYFRTIKPAPYPLRTTPAHIHAVLYGPGYAEYSIDDYWFEGDKFITPSERAKLTGRGGFNSIITLRKDKLGILRGERNIKLERL
jgi:protocatechuate 3,4-dioxygenase beta subunit